MNQNGLFLVILNSNISLKQFNFSISILNNAINTSLGI
jgi:hypothetical protein